MILKIKTFIGHEFDVECESYELKDGVYYANGSSYPESIVLEVLED